LHLKATDPHYVRCIKPNDSKQPLVFDPAMVMSQLNYCGVLDTLKIRQSGLPVRFPVEEFCKRYGYLVPTASSAEQICRALTPWLGEAGSR
jgi:myosin heavy subunit